MHIQAIFVIFTFSEHHVEVLLDFVEGIFPFLSNKLSSSLEQQKQKLWYKNNNTGVESVINCLLNLF